jgi:hypothetical protein
MKRHRMSAVDCEQEDALSPQKGQGEESVCGNESEQAAEGAE